MRNCEDNTETDLKRQGVRKRTDFMWLRMGSTGWRGALAKQ
jgi:hypothetical protein